MVKKFNQNMSLNFEAFISTKIITVRIKSENIQKYNANDCYIHNFSFRLKITGKQLANVHQNNNYILMLCLCSSVVILGL